MTGKQCNDREDALWEDHLLCEPQFTTRVAAARASLRQGRGINVERLREKRGLLAEATQLDEKTC